MLKKLLKYDLKLRFKPLVVFYILAIFFAIITRCVESMEQSLVVVIIDKICSGTLIAMLINIVINCFIINWVRFITNIYKDESYLTHTLPVSKSNLYLSKVLTGIITVFMSAIVIIASIVIATFQEGTLSYLKNVLEESATFFNTSELCIVIVLVTTVFLEVMCMLMSGILGIIIGHKSNYFKVLKSIIIGFAIYMLMSVTALGIVYFSGLFNSDIMALFESTTPSTTGMTNAMIIVMAFYMIYLVVSYIIGNKLLNKGVNVD